MNNFPEKITENIFKSSLRRLKNKKYEYIEILNPLEKNKNIEYKTTANNEFLDLGNEYVDINYSAMKKGSYNITCFHKEKNKNDSIIAEIKVYNNKVALCLKGYIKLLYGVNDENILVDVDPTILTAEIWKIQRSTIKMFETIRL